MAKKEKMRSCQVDSELIRNTRRELGYTQEKLADEANLSPNTVLRAERDGSVSFSTAKLLCDALGKAYSQIVITNYGVTPVRNIVPPLESSATRHVVFEEFDGETESKRIFEFISQLLPYLGEEEIRILKAELGSVHLELEMSRKGAKLLDEICDINTQGELILDCNTTKRVILWLSDRSETLSLELQAEAEKHGKAKALAKALRAELSQNDCFVTNDYGDSVQVPSQAHFH